MCTSLIPNAPHQTQWDNCATKLPFPFPTHPFPTFHKAQHGFGHETERAKQSKHQ